MKRTFMLIVALLSVTTLLKAQHQPPPIEWQILIGGSLKDDGRMVHQTTDGGYILTATTFSNNRDVSGNHGSGDVWVVKLTATGNIVWQKCLGGTAYDEAWSILQVNDGGYILAGMAKSINGNVTSSHGNDEFWIVKLDASGNITWQKTYGGSSYEIVIFIV